MLDVPGHEGESGRKRPLDVAEGVGVSDEDVVIVEDGGGGVGEEVQTAEAQSGASGGLVPGVLGGILGGHDSSPGVR